jgi:hypothetical protein
MDSERANYARSPGRRVPAEWHGREILAFAACYCGDPADGEKALAELRSLGKPIADVIGLQPFTAWQATFDPLLAPGARNYWKSHDFVELPDAMIQALLSAIRNLPSPECEVFHRASRGSDGQSPCRCHRLPAAPVPLRYERPHSLA